MGAKPIRPPAICSLGDIVMSAIRVLAAQRSILTYTACVVQVYRRSAYVCVLAHEVEPPRSTPTHVHFRLNHTIPYDPRDKNIHNRWGELRGSRREAYERNRSTLEAAHEKSGSTAPVATLARTTALAQGQQTAEAIVKHYLDGAGHGATAAEAKATATTAARAITQSQEAVSNSVAAAGAERELKEEDCEARAAEVSEIESEDTAVKVRVCQTAVQEWWTQLAAAVEEGLHRQEKEIEERR